MESAVFPDVVELNIGGKLMTTLLSSLTKDPESMLAAMFSGRHVISKDKDGRFFIDCDGNLFEYILNFLRFGTLPPKEKALEMYDVAVYFNLQLLARSLESYRVVQYQRRIEEMKNSLDIQEYERLKKDALEQLYKCCARPEDNIIVLFISHERLCTADCNGPATTTSLDTAFEHTILLYINNEYATEIKKEMQHCIAHDLNQLGFGKYVYFDKDARCTCNHCGEGPYALRNVLLVASKFVESEEDGILKYKLI